jgi:hypothetical protein
MKRIIKIGDILKKFKLMYISTIVKEKEDFLKCKNQGEVFWAVWCVVAQEKAKTHYQEEEKWK